MKNARDINLKAAFGATPPSVEHCIRRALHTDPRRYMMKRKMIISLTAALLAVLMLGTVALAGQYGIPALFSTNDMQNEQVAAAVQPMNQTYAGQYVSLTITEGFYDAQGKTFALSWQATPLTDTEGLIVLCDKLTFGGEISLGNSYSLSELNGSMAGALYEGSTPACEITFSVVRKSSNGDSQLLDRSWEYTSEGLGEVLETFTMAFRMPEQHVGKTLRLKGENHFIFDDYELIVEEAALNATSAYARVQYITSEAPLDLGKGFGPAWDLTFTLDDNAFFYAVGSGSWEDPVQLEDGRWKSVYIWEAQNLFSQPSRLVMTLTTYELAPGRTVAVPAAEHPPVDSGETAVVLAGEENAPVATVHAQEAITLTFE